ncbi:MAG: PDZ domain-containing protein [Acidobacteria bacterium]|nr:PDZ domain-containing protein [Acidobacteriota bacterium]
MIWAVLQLLTADNLGYYRMPSLHQETIVFSAEGDLWKVSKHGGQATRLTTHAEQELFPEISPDGSKIAFSATYHGAQEVYVMPIQGGLPQRLTFDADQAVVRGWTPNGKVIYSTSRYSRLPSQQLHLVDPTTLERTPVPLAQADMGEYSPDGKTLYFNRLPFNGSWTKRYKGGTIQQIWVYREGAAEAQPLTVDYEGTSKDPMIVGDRVYFTSDRDGTMNLWSMKSDGSDTTQHTFHAGHDIREADAFGPEIVYQWGADLYLFDSESNVTRLIPIQLVSDFEQRRTQWVDDIQQQITSLSLAPKGDKVAVTARGRTAIMPVGEGRIVEIAKPGIRMREATFVPESDEILQLSDESGEAEFWLFDSADLKAPKQLTHDAKVLRGDINIAPNGKIYCFSDQDARLWYAPLEAATPKLVEQSPYFGIGRTAWSPDSQWLAYTTQAENGASIIRLFHPTTGERFDATSDRVESYSPTWSSEGDFLYFLSDRNQVSAVSSPWGAYQPEPFFHAPTEIYALALNRKASFPFLEKHELMPDKQDDKKDEKKDDKDPPKTTIDREGLFTRLYQVPVPAANYGSLQVTSKRLYFMTRQVGERNSNLMTLKISNESPEAKTFAKDINGYQLSLDGEKILLVKDQQWLVGPADADEMSKDAKGLPLNNWKPTINPLAEWRQMLVDAWRLERDYFYDPEMHGVDWDKVLANHLPLVDRVTTRQELNDLIAQMVGELSALHTFVVGGDTRDAQENVSYGSLGADWERHEKGYRITYIYQHEPDYLDLMSPLARPEVHVTEGDVVTAINGTSTLSVNHPSSLLMDTVGQQVRLSILSKTGDTRDVIVKPISENDASNLRYTDWEVTRRQLVDHWSDENFGYVHLRAMGGRNYTEWARNYFPIYQRQGLILDVRHNRGGNIDSWILSRLLRPIWFYWKGRDRNIYPNMQYAFGGHMVLLMDEFTASDGEAISEGFRRLGLGPLIGTRTWGGEIWLSFNNRLADGGIASAAQSGVFGLEREWLIEGVGVIPDMEVDNLPHETFNGTDRQLRAAVDYLKKKMQESPITRPEPPPYPDKSFSYPERQ